LQGAESSETDIPRFKSANPDDSFRKNDESSPDLRRKRVTASYDGEFSASGCTRSASVRLKTFGVAIRKLI